MYEPNYTITNTILKNISRIDVAREIILLSPLIPMWERKFQDDAVVRIIHYSTHIENNPLSYTQVGDILGGKLTRFDVRVRDYQEIINYREVLKYIDQSFGEGLNGRVNLRTLLKVHRILSDRIIPEEMSGIIRNVPVVLVNSKTKNISYRAPDHEDVESLLEEFFIWYNSKEAKDIHPVLRSGIMHTQIARIHPFVEVNGRTARSMATLGLFKDGYDIKRFFCLDEHYDRDLPRYYTALQSVDKRNGDMTGWLEYFSDGLAEELGHIREKVLEFSRDSKRRMQSGQIALTERQLKLLSYIEDKFYINGKRWRELYPSISDDTVLRDLNVLISNKLIKRVGKTKGARYVLV